MDILPIRVVGIRCLLEFGAAIVSDHRGAYLLPNYQLTGSFPVTLNINTMIITTWAPSNRVPNNMECRNRPSARTTRHNIWKAEVFSCFGLAQHAFEYDSWCFHLSPNYFSKLLQSSVKWMSPGSSAPAIMRDDIHMCLVGDQHRFTTDTFSNVELTCTHVIRLEKKTSIKRYIICFTERQPRNGISGQRYGEIPSMSVQAFPLSNVLLLCLPLLQIVCRDIQYV